MEPLLFTRRSNIYADDTPDKVQRKISNLEQQASSIGLSVNAKKDKSINKQQLDTATYCDQQSSTRVRQQVHLPGEHHQSPRRCRRRYQSTIGKSQVSILNSTAALLWRSSVYSQKTKLRIYQNNVLSVLLYGSECWCMTQQDTNICSSFHNTCLRKILKMY